MLLGWSFKAVKESISPYFPTALPYALSLAILFRSWLDKRLSRRFTGSKEDRYRIRPPGFRCPTIVPARSAQLFAAPNGLLFLWVLSKRGDLQAQIPPGLSGMDGKSRAQETARGPAGREGGEGFLWH